MTADEAIRLLRRKHPADKGKWATITEFCRVDFVAVACWPSAGYEVHGFEIKVSRGDWRRDLGDPTKHAAGLGMCDFYWLAAPPGVLADGELPSKWGFVELGKTARVRTKPRRLRPTVPKSHFLKGGPNRALYEREAFAMLARRFAYAQADADAMGAAMDREDRQDALDQAALATGRFTAKARAAQRIQDRENREYRRTHKIHSAHVREGVDYMVDCPLDWCSARAV